MPTRHYLESEIEEAAEYWDTHSVTDENSEPVPGPAFIEKPLGSSFVVRLDCPDVVKLRSLAKANGIGQTAMARKLLRRAISQARYDGKDSPEPSPYLRQTST